MIITIMKLPIEKLRHFLPLIAGIAVLLFSSVAVARIMGWLPNTTDASGGMAAIDPLTTAFPFSDPASESVRSRPNASTKRRCPQCGVIASKREIGASANGQGDDELLAKAAKRYEFSVRLDDGTYRAITDANPAAWRLGERVSIIDGIDLASR